MRRATAILSAVVLAAWLGFVFLSTDASGQARTTLDRCYGHACAVSTLTSSGAVSGTTASFTTGTFSGDISRTADAATNRAVNFQTAGVNRWIVRANTTAESGSDVGSDLEFLARTDAGAAKSTTMWLQRSTGTVITNKLAVGSGGATISKHLSGTATWDPESLTAGQYDSTTVTVTGAAVGDTVAVGFSNAVPAGVLLAGAVSATNTVTVTLLNVTTGTVNLSSGTLRADAWEH